MMFQPLVSTLMLEISVLLIAYLGPFFFFNFSVLFGGKFLGLK